MHQNTHLKRHQSDPYISITKSFLTCPGTQKQSRTSFLDSKDNHNIKKNNCKLNKLKQQGLTHRHNPSILEQIKNNHRLSRQNNIVSPSIKGSDKFVKSQYQNDIDQYEDNHQDYYSSCQQKYPHLPKNQKNHKNSVNLKYQTKSRNDQSPYNLYKQDEEKQNYSHMVEQTIIQGKTKKYYFNSPKRHKFEFDTKTQNNYQFTQMKDNTKSPVVITNYNYYFASDDQNDFFRQVDYNSLKGHTLRNIQHDSKSIKNCYMNLKKQQLSQYSLPQNTSNHMNHPIHTFLQKQNQSCSYNFNKNNKQNFQYFSGFKQQQNSQQCLMQLKNILIQRQQKQSTHQSRQKNHINPNKKNNVNPRILQHGYNKKLHISSQPTQLYLQQMSHQELQASNQQLDYQTQIMIHHYEQQNQKLQLQNEKLINQIEQKVQKQKCLVQKINYLMKQVEKIKNQNIYKEKINSKETQKYSTNVSTKNSWFQVQKQNKIIQEQDQTNLLNFSQSLLCTKSKKLIQYTQRQQNNKGKFPLPGINKQRKTPKKKSTTFIGSDTILQYSLIDDTSPYKLDSKKQYLSKKPINQQNSIEMINNNSQPNQQQLMNTSNITLDNSKPNNRFINDLSISGFDSQFVPKMSNQQKLAQLQQIFEVQFKKLFQQSAKNKQKSINKQYPRKQRSKYKLNTIIKQIKQLRSLINKQKE